MDEQKISNSLASSLHGQLNFAQGQFLGAEMKPAMAFLSQVASARWDSSRRQVLEHLQHMLRVYFGLANLDVWPSEMSKLQCWYWGGAWGPTSGSLVGAGLMLVDPTSGSRLVSEVMVLQQLIDH